MTDQATLAVTIFNFLLPHLDYIRGKVADSALTESGKALVALLKDKWLAKSETARAALADAAGDPTDEDNRQAVITQLRKALKANPDFANEVERLVTAAGIQVNIAGDNNKTAVAQGTGNVIEIH